MPEVRNAARKILLILGHPRRDSFCAGLADAYAQGASGAGHELRRYDLGELQFNVVLDGRYRQAEQTLEPILIELQQAIRWADHLVFVYPTWWGVMPALLKGFFDRAFLPGFAFKYRKGSKLWDRLLSGRSARALVTMDSPPWYYRWVKGAPGHVQLRSSILGFAGIKPVQIHSIGPIRGSKPAQREQWLARALHIGASE
jgi:NAD(P)H dehydrogenase (quinone)